MSTTAVPNYKLQLDCWEMFFNGIFAIYRTNGVKIWGFKVQNGWKWLRLYYIIVKKMRKENKSWSEHEDGVLRSLREDRGLKKWSSISKIMEEQFGIRDKSGKRCRQRYHNHVNSRVRKDEWTVQEENILFRLHNEIGNKWTDIAKELGRSDNAIKNHYHSKLRKALRKINKIIYDNLKYQFKPIKNNVLPKLIQTAEGYYLQSDREANSIAKKCFVMKNRILCYLKEQQKEIDDQGLVELRLLARELNHFNKIYKKKNKKNNEKGSRNSCNQYKGKEIICLINQNNRKCGDSEKESSMPMSEDSSEDDEDHLSASSQAQAKPNKECNITEQSICLPSLQAEPLFPHQSLYFMIYQPLRYSPMLTPTLLNTSDPQFYYTYMS